MINQPNNQSTTQNPVGRFMVAVGAVIEHAKTGKILLLQRASDLDWQPGEWEIGYGRIDQFEDAETGLRREVREEVGITDLLIGKVFSIWHIFRGPEKAANELIGITYHCITHHDQPTLSKEHQAFKWVTAEEALELVTVEGIRRDIQRFIELKAETKKLIGREVIGVGVGALIFNDDGKLLLTKRGQKAKNERGKWEIPGGSVEFGETVAQALKREVKEELDIEIKVGEMVQLCDHIIEDEGQHWVSPSYICKLVAGEPTIMEPEKCDEIRWVSLEEAQQLPLALATKEDVAVLLQREK
jgi:mutator protein MutT